MWGSKPQHQFKPKTILTWAQNNNNKSSAQQPAKQLGLTSPISWDGPCPEDLDKTEELRKALEFHNVFESEEELKHRMAVLGKLNTLVQQWLQEVSAAKNMSKAAAENLGGKLFTFGSYRLGVHHKGADIDALCVAPRSIERADFFTSFFEMLKKQPEVTECRAIEKAYVPVIKMNFDGIEVDLLFARLSLKEIPEDIDLRDDNILKHMDLSSIRSLNGCRVTDEIMALVPNIENFRLALRSIKLWAKQHGIYSNSLGYFGGVSWAILVARTCQLYPNAAPSTLIQKFFLIFWRWIWPRPLLLRRTGVVNLRLPEWDPRINLDDRSHLMPIITPAYPQQNSTFNVTESTKKVLLMELKRGNSAMDEIMSGKASWDRLFEAPSFFYRYRHFVVLLVNSRTASDHVEWCGLVESKIRLLVGNLERMQHISLVHLNPKCFAPKKINNDKGTSPNCSMWFIGLEFERVENLTVDLTESIQQFVDQVMQHSVKIKMHKEGMSIEACHAKRQQLSQFLDADFLKRESKTKDGHMNSDKAVAVKRKRLSQDAETKDVSGGNSAKRSRTNSCVSTDSGLESGNSTPRTQNGASD